jgi:hypothetical protein
LRQQNQSLQQSQAWKPGNQLQSNVHRQPQGYKPSHSCLGHVSSSHLKFLASTEALENLWTYDISDYSGCKLTKFPSLPFNRIIHVSSALFDLTHFDV